MTCQQTSNQLVTMKELNFPPPCHSALDAESGFWIPVFTGMTRKAESEFPPKDRGNNVASYGALDPKRD